MSRLDRQASLPRVWPLAAALALVATGCRQDMHDAPRIDPLEAHAFFEDGQGARPLPAGTVPRGFLNDDPVLATGKDAAGAFVDTLPMALTGELLDRGRQRFDIYCSPCHDRTGSGTGMIVRRGFKQPESYHSARLRSMPLGYYFDVMTNGFGVMSSYALQVPVRDRWAIAAYIRALQVSQGSALGDLSPAMVEAFHQAESAPADDHAGGHDGDHGGVAHEGAASEIRPGYGMRLPAAPKGHDEAEH